MAENGRRKREDALAVALAAGETLRAAASAAGIGERTASRRWADPTFRARVTGLRGEAVARGIGRMGDAMAEAADVLRRLLSAQSESVRLGAARSILELGTKFRETVELEERIMAIESQLGAV